MPAIDGASRTACHSSSLNALFPVTWPPLVVAGRLVEDGQVELAEALRVAEEVHLDNLPAPHGDGPDREHLAVLERDRAGCAVDQRATHVQPHPGVEERLADDGAWAADDSRSAFWAEVRPNHDVRVEQLEQRLEVAVARRGQERV